MDWTTSKKVTSMVWNRNELGAVKQVVRRIGRQLKRVSGIIDAVEA